MTRSTTRRPRTTTTVFSYHQQRIAAQDARMPEALRAVLSSRPAGQPQAHTLPATDASTLPARPGQRTDAPAPADSTKPFSIFK